MSLYARIIDGAIDGPFRRPRKSGEPKLLDGTVVRPGERGWTDTLLAACGFVEVVTVRPTLAADEAMDGFTDSLVDGQPTRTYIKRAKTADELAAEVDNAARQAKRETVGGAVATLRSWADDAETTTVNATNAVAVLQRVVDRLGVFFDRFADLIEAERIDEAEAAGATAAAATATPKRGPARGPS